MMSESDEFWMIAWERERERDLISIFSGDNPIEAIKTLKKSTVFGNSECY
jgi:hypothetical protein